jgi:putative ABC transport system permease protein
MKKWMLASRTLTRRPGFALAAILILALGIGTNTAMFSMVDSILLKPLPYPHGDRLVTVLEASAAKNQKESLIAPARLEDWNRMNRTFDAIAGIYSESVTDTSGAEPERLDGRRVSPRYFDVFGMKPLLGRTFTPQEDVLGGPTSAVISEPFWNRRYHSDPRIIGKRLIVGGTGFTIVGVMPRQFAGPTVDVWLPAQLSSFLLVKIREARFYSGVGRLKPGVTRAQAQEDLDRVQKELGREYPSTDAGWSALVGDLKEFRVGHYRKTLYFVFSALVLLLLIAVANIAGLMLSQLHRRSKELAIRSSIGGTRAQVIGSVFREVAIISAAGVVLGCLLAVWLVGFESTAFDILPRASEIGVDWRALVFAASAGVLTAILCGLLPALQATRSDVNALLAEGGRGDSGGRHNWQSILVGSQIALTLLLLASAGLMLRSYYNLAHVNPGFDAEHAITFHVGAAWDEDRKRVGQTQVDLIEKLQRYPGVEAAGFTNFLPASGATLRYQVTLEGLASAEDGGRLTVGERSITSGYLKAMGAQIVDGQSCPALRAVPSGPAKVLVSSRFASLYGNGQNLVGRHVFFAGVLPNATAMEIVGIVGNMKEDTLSVTPAPYVYVCIGPGAWPDPEYVVRAQGDPQPLLSAIRPLVHSVAPSRAVFGVKTVQKYLDDTIDQPRMNTRMLSIFAIAALLLASVGLYSLVSLSVTSRTREIGVRMTLGAQPSRIVLQVLTGVARLLAAGIVAGLLLMFAVERLLRSVLFDVTPADGLTLAATIVVLVIVAGAATLIPARKASKIDPLQAIK